MDLPQLNRRHKAALWLALGLCGLGLLTGSGIKEGIGVLLLGVVFAWALGSNSRLVHSAFIAAGLTIMAWAGVAWHRHSVELAAYQQANPYAAFQQASPYVGFDARPVPSSQSAAAMARALTGAALLGIGTGLLIGVKGSRRT